METVEPGTYPAMQKWEYLVINVTYREGSDFVIESISSNYQRVFSNILEDELVTFLNQLANDGWELTDIHSLNDGRNEAYYFKRLME